MNDPYLFLGGQYITSYDDFLQAVKVACAHTDGKGVRLRSELCSAVRDGVIGDWLLAHDVNLAEQSIFTTNCCDKTDAQIISEVTHTLGLKVKTSETLNWKDYLRPAKSFYVEMFNNQDELLESGESDISITQLTSPLGCSKMKFTFRLEIINSCNENINLNIPGALEVETPLSIDLRDIGKTVEIRFSMTAYEHLRSSVRICYLKHRIVSIVCKPPKDIIDTAKKIKDAANDIKDAAKDLNDVATRAKDMLQKGLEYIIKNDIN